MKVTKPVATTARSSAPLCEPQEPKYRTVDCFAGVGGTRLGFAPHGVKCVWSCEFDADAARTYEHNFGDDPTGDMTLQNPFDIPYHDILLACWPCTDFSWQGKKQGLRGANSSKISYIYDVLAAKMPKAFFLENVASVLYGPMKNDFDSVLRKLSRLGYDVYWAVLNARNFGLPQNRERIFIVGFSRSAVPFEFPIGGQLAANVPEFLDADVPDRFYLSDAKFKSLTKARLEQADIGNKYGFQFILDGFAATLVANPDGRKRNIWIDDAGRKRFLTPREYARLQGFPDSFWLPSDDLDCNEKRSRSNDGKAYHQIGNSVPIPVVTEIAERIVAVLRESDRA